MRFHKTKVVTRNIFIDTIAKFQNFVGLNLTGYEKMIERAIEQIWQELGNDIESRAKWYRIETNQLTNGAISVIVYGEV